MMARYCWTGAGLLGVSATALIADKFTVYSPWFYIGLTGLITAGQTANTAWVARRSRTLDAEFDAGYRVGHRAGRRVGAPMLIHLDDRRRTDGGVSQAPLGSMAGFHTPPRRAASDSD